LETQTIIAGQRKYLNDSEFQELLSDINVEMRMLASLIKALPPK